jgi:hypothetical protein
MKVPDRSSIRPRSCSVFITIGRTTRPVPRIDYLTRAGTESPVAGLHRNPSPLSNSTSDRLPVSLTTSVRCPPDRLARSSRREAATRHESARFRRTFTRTHGANSPLECASPFRRNGNIQIAGSAATPSIGPLAPVSAHDAHGRPVVVVISGIAPHDVLISRRCHLQRRWQIAHSWNPCMSSSPRHFLMRCRCRRSSTARLLHPGCLCCRGRRRARRSRQHACDRFRSRGADAMEPGEIVLRLAAEVVEQEKRTKSSVLPNPKARRSHAGAFEGRSRLTTLLTGRMDTLPLKGRAPTRATGCRSARFTTPPMTPIAAILRSLGVQTPSSPTSASSETVGAGRASVAAPAATTAVMFS